MTLDIDEVLRAAAERYGLPSIALGVARDGELTEVHALGALSPLAGRPSADSVYRIASMTKSFTASAVLLLRDRGLLELDAPVRRYLAWFDDDRTSVRDLLTMNGGFPTDDPWGDRHEPTPLPDFDALVANGLRRARPARTGFEYSNLGYALLGRVISSVTGREYTAFVTEELLQPLGMHSSTFDHRLITQAQAAQGYRQRDGEFVAEPAVLPGAFSPMGGLHSSIRDLTRWVGGFVAAWRAPDAPHPLSVASRLEQQQPHTFARMSVTAGDPPTAVSTAYGYGLLVEEHSTIGRVVQHSGGYPGFGSNMRWHPATGLAVVALANRTYAQMFAVADEVLRELVAAEPAADPWRDLWPETQAAVDAAESLLRAWDDDLADRWFAHNMDLDAPRHERVADVATLRSGLGDVQREQSSATSRTPAHARWALVDSAGTRIWVEVLMSPDAQPRIQALRFERERD